MLNKDLDERNSNKEYVNLKSWFETCTGLLTCSQNKFNNTFFY